MVTSLVRFVDRVQVDNNPNTAGSKRKTTKAYCNRTLGIRVIGIVSDALLLVLFQLDDLHKNLHYMAFIILQCSKGILISLTSLQVYNTRKSHLQVVNSSIYVARSKFINGPLFCILVRLESVDQ